MKTLEQCVQANVRNVIRKAGWMIKIDRHPKAPYTNKEVFDAVCMIMELSNTEYRKARGHCIGIVPKSVLDRDDVTP